MNYNLSEILDKYLESEEYKSYLKLKEEESAEENNEDSTTDKAQEESTEENNENNSDENTDENKEEKEGDPESQDPAGLTTEELMNLRNTLVQNLNSLKMLDDQGDIIIVNISSGSDNNIVVNKRGIMKNKEGKNVTSEATGYFTLNVKKQKKSKWNILKKGAQKTGKALNWMVNNMGSSKPTDISM